MDRAAIQERFGLLGESPALVRVIDRVRQVGRSDVTVLLEGESGVGKELVAQALHGISNRRHKALVVVNCGAIPEGLIESELFGAEKGAYTGSVERRVGYFEEANGGTLFLDEIGEMPLAAQVKLLRVLETGTYTRVGTSVSRQTDVRVVAATNRDLGEEVRAGRFREDLYYRLSTVIIDIPPVRERGHDAVLLFQMFLHKFAQKYNASPRKLSPDAEHLIRSYRWPGNVREIRNVAEQAVVLHTAPTLLAADLQGFLRGVTAGQPPTLLPALRPPDPQPPVDTGVGTEARERELLYRALLEIRYDVRDMKAQLNELMTAVQVTRDDIERVYQPPARGDNFVIVRDDVPYAEPVVEAPIARIRTLEEIEREMIFRALDECEGNRRLAAEKLGISERTLYRKIRMYEGGETVHDDPDA